MTAPVLVVGRAASADDGAVIGIFEVVDLGLHTVATGVLRNDRKSSAGPLAVGRYFARASLASGQRPSVPFEVTDTNADDSPVVVVLEDPGDTGSSTTPSGNGWLAGWRFDVDQGTFTPANPGDLSAAGRAVALSSAEHTANILLQWLIEPHGALFTAAIPGQLVRFGAEGSSIVLGPEPSTATTLMAFLQAGDVPAVRTLASAILSDTDPPEPTTAVALGYCLLRCGDPRLGRWTHTLALSQPESFDAQLLHASALMRDPYGWPDARAQLLNATRHGLPLFTQGFRVLDDGLRLLIQGTGDEELALARLRFVPYLRACLNRPLTTFWGANPAMPVPAATDSTRPAHARFIRLDSQYVTLHPAPTPRVVRGARPTSATPEDVATRTQVIRHQPFNPQSARSAPSGGSSRVLLDTPAVTPALGYDRIAIALATLIQESEPRFAVGVFGGWGSGKTTLMDAIRAELRNPNTLKVVFNGWRYEREPHLIVPLLDTIRGAIVAHAATEAGRLAREVLLAVASRIGQVVRALVSGLSGKMPVGVAEVSFDAAKSADALSDGGERPAQEAQSLYYACFEQLAGAFADLRASGVDRVVVFVDDLDRCLPQNALSVIESMKLFFDLTGFVFVVGIDQRVLERAIRERLAGVQAAAGDDRNFRLAEREYVKKIFQVPYELPPMHAEQLDDLLTAIYDTAGIGGEQLEDLRTTVRPYLAHLAIEGRVNPREVKRFINAYTLQMLIRPQLDRATVLAVQTVVFRYDWALYDILRAETEALPQAIQQYRDGEDSALTDLWPAQIGALPTDLAQFLRSAEAAPLTRQDLRTYLTSVEGTTSTEGWVGRAYILIGRLRRIARQGTASLEQGATGSQLERISRELASAATDLRSAVVDEQRGSERFAEHLNSLLDLARAISSQSAASWSEGVERSVGNLQRELRLLRATPARPLPAT
ncbi:P-loop NTPase fold protein [Dactylosporangium sp. NPDC005572]|uniref:KAP family P-loop NTPase fold protein n=1 Tax=Dactylosporangium sp. NPDC005572 TaxID=3156889 RepID=UPI0033BF3021